MVDYSNSKIYKLCCRDENIKEIYVGSTMNYISRLHSHRHISKTLENKNSKSKLYTFIRQNGGFDNWKLEIIESTSVNTLNELKSIERKYIEELKPDLNTNLPTRSNEEYYQNNREYFIEKMKKYVYDNKSKYLLKHHCQCGGIYCHFNKTKHEKTKKHMNYINSIQN